MSVDDFSCKAARRAMGTFFSAYSSTGTNVHAQRNRFTITIRNPFPHFHSDGYYYYLYTSLKTGYSSPSQ
jgi:hypothetical protein